MQCGRGQSSSLNNRGQLNEPFPEPETQSAVPHNSQVICPQISVSINDRTLLMLTVSSCSNKYRDAPVSNSSFIHGMWVKITNVIKLKAPRGMGFVQGSYRFVTNINLSGRRWRRRKLGNPAGLYWLRALDSACACPLKNDHTLNSNLKNQFQICI